jgi:hypothetical protein
MAPTRAIRPPRIGVLTGACWVWSSRPPVPVLGRRAGACATGPLGAWTAGVAAGRAAVAETAGGGGGGAGGRAVAVAVAAPPGGGGGGGGGGAPPPVGGGGGGGGGGGDPWANAVPEIAREKAPARSRA